MHVTVDVREGTCWCCQKGGLQPLTPGSDTDVLPGGETLHASQASIQEGQTPHLYTSEMCSMGNRSCPSGQESAKLRKWVLFGFLSIKKFQGCTHPSRVTFLSSPRSPYIRHASNSKVLHTLHLSLMQQMLLV